MNSANELLKQARIRAGLTQKEVSNHFGFTTSQFISNLELAKSPIPPKMIRPLADMYGISYSRIVAAMAKDFKSQITSECES